MAEVVALDELDFELRIEDIIKYASCIEFVYLLKDISRLEGEVSVKDGLVRVRAKGVRCVKVADGGKWAILIPSKTKCMVVARDRHYEYIRVRDLEPSRDYPTLSLECELKDVLGFDEDTVKKVIAMVRLLA
jgi:hypothetical protein